jgi:hypothetical protein
MQNLTNNRRLIVGLIGAILVTAVLVLLVAGCGHGGGGGGGY